MHIIDYIKLTLEAFLSIIIIIYIIMRYKSLKNKYGNLPFKEVIERKISDLNKQESHIERMADLEKRVENLEKRISEK